ncbi:hypothetical protein SDC9_132408 [bioreactor metagenome]|uniref:Uncharacterized protein n=1 Tax=bioreactor metagenome TaxID=1076179 RepID=A0A645D736_9ZZZZ
MSLWKNTQMLLFILFMMENIQMETILIIWDWVKELGNFTTKVL